MHEYAILLRKGRVGSAGFERANVLLRWVDTQFEGHCKAIEHGSSCHPKLINSCHLGGFPCGVDGPIAGAERPLFLWRPCAENDTVVLALLRFIMQIRLYLLYTCHVSFKYLLHITSLYALERKFTEPQIETTFAGSMYLTGYTMPAQPEAAAKSAATSSFSSSNLSTYRRGPISANEMMGAKCANHVQWSLSQCTITSVRNSIHFRAFSLYPTLGKTDRSSHGE